MFSSAEPAILDALAAETQAPVTERNSLFSLQCRGFRLRGRIDGLSEATNTIVESKSRQCPMARAGQPRMAHLVQCRAYLRLLPHVSRCILRERFGCGGVRDSELFADEGLWAMIEGQLTDVAARYAALTEADVHLLVEQNCRRIAAREPGPHRHPLMLTDSRRRAQCDVCGGRSQSFSSCVACDYDECVSCFEKARDAAAAAAESVEEAVAEEAMAEETPPVSLGPTAMPQ
jgi:hypothetical protein